MKGSLRLRGLLRTAAATVGAVAAGVARTVVNRGARPAITLQPGDAAPPFALEGSDGRTYRLRDLLGHTVVLAWFPKAFTGG